MDMHTKTTEQQFDNGVCNINRARVQHAVAALPRRAGVSLLQEVTMSARTSIIVNS